MKVFLSYAVEDKNLARDVADGLEQAGFEVWFDERRLMPGENFALEVGRALEESDAMVVLVSPESAKSPWVRNAITFAIGSPRYEDRLIPVVVRPTEGMPWIVRRMKSLNIGRDRKTLARRIAARLIPAGRENEN